MMNHHSVRHTADHEDRTPLQLENAQRLLRDRDVEAVPTLARIKKAVTEQYPPEFEVFNAARRRQGKSLDAIPRATLVSLIFKWLEAWLRAPCIDYEAIEDAGALVGESGHKGIDAAVHEWAESKSLAHQDAAGAFLAGCWKASSPRVDLMTYAALLDRLPPDERAFASVVYAVHKALAYDDGSIDALTKDALRSRLLAVRKTLKDTGLHPSVLVSLGRW